MRFTSLLLVLVHRRRISRNHQAVMSQFAEAHSDGAYAFVDWPTPASSGRSGSSSSTGLMRIETEPLTQRRDDGSTVEVGTHFKGDFEELKSWVPINMILFEVSKLKFGADKHNSYADEVQGRYATDENVWSVVNGTINGSSVSFDVCAFNASSAAIAQINDAVVTLIGRDIDLRTIDLDLAPQI